MVKRECGECTACCTAIAVREFGKPPGTPCKHECGDGCAIYKKRPKSCRDFDCLWILGSFDEHERPDKLGVVFSAEPESGFIEKRTGVRLLGAHEQVPGALKKHDAWLLIERLARKWVMVLWTDEGKFLKGPPELVAKVAELLTVKRGES